jgi:CBS domain-containing protein
MTILASDIMSSPAVTVRPFTGVHDIAKLMAEKGISAVPVLGDDDVMVGIVSDEDIIKPFRESARLKRDWWLAMLAAGETLSQEFLDFTRADMRTAAEIMVKHVVTADEKTTLPELADLMVTRRIRRIPILRAGHVVGIVSRPDLVGAIARAPAMLS